MDLAMLTLLVLLLAAADARQFSESSGSASVPATQRFRTSAGDTQAAAATQPSAGSPAPELYKDILQMHNDYREMHDASDLSWSADLATAAAAATQPCVFKHSGQEYGENIYATWGGGVPDEAALKEALKYAITGWYGEVSKYDYSNPGFTMGTGHFTQVVWIGTTLLGCHVRSCPALTGFGGNPVQGIMVACEYDPPGNYMGEFQSNVKPKTNTPPGGSSPSPKPVVRSPSPSPRPVTPSPKPLPEPKFTFGSSLSVDDVLTPGTCLLSDNEKYRLCVNAFGSITVQYGRSDTRTRWTNAMPLADKTNAKRPYSLFVSEYNMVTGERGCRLLQCTALSQQHTC
uniref:SCP domain-containing protein n=1 Tax=Tetradesmus obliquus TaxID=3088 RepID=A0A383VKD2_TETOB|eukprot:jgi/Sobl393_1/10062/SZX65380.1